MTQYKDYPVVAEAFIDSGVDIVAAPLDEKDTRVEALAEPALSKTRAKSAASDSAGGRDGTASSATKEVPDALQRQLDLGDERHTPD